jgi:hypothetical protein
MPLAEERQTWGETNASCWRKTDNTMAKSKVPMIYKTLHKKLMIELKMILERL